jgi:hypothetical protein
MVTDQRRGLHKPQSISWKAIIGTIGGFRSSNSTVVGEEASAGHTTTSDKWRFAFQRRLYEALKLQVAVNVEGDREVRGDFDHTTFPSQEKAYELLAGMIGVPEHRPQNDSLRALIGRALASTAGTLCLR